MSKYMPFEEYAKTVAYPSDAFTETQLHVLSDYFKYLGYS